MKWYESNNVLTMFCVLVFALIYIASIVFGA